MSHEIFRLVDFDITNVKESDYNFKHDMLMRGIKIIDIGYITVIYFTIAMILCICIDKLMGEYKDEDDEQKSTTILWIETIIYMWLIGIVIYVIRNLVEKIPFPLNGVGGFDHLKVKELGGAGVFSYFFFAYQFVLKNRLMILYRKTKKSFFGVLNIKDNNSDSNHTK